MEEGERKNVYQVYNRIADWFSGNRYAGLPEKSHLDDWIERIPDKGTVFDFGS